MNRLRALIVDDDFAVATVHRGFVESHPHFIVVGEAHTGADALNEISRLDPDVVLLDFYLPDFSGLEVLARLRLERARRLEVIAVTAARDLNSVRSARANGVRHYLVKPFTANALRERLDAIARHQAVLRNAAAKPLDQSAVDAILGDTGGIEQPPPKGLSVATLTRIGEVLAGTAGDLSATEVAERLGMSRVGARRYLEHLARTGAARVDPRYGATGRPEHRYRWIGASQPER